MAVQPRDKDEAVRELQYEVRVHQLHSRLYRRIRFAIAFVSLAAGCSAITAAVQSHPKVLAAMGAVVALASILDALAGFSEKQFNHRQWCQQFTKILSRQFSMTMEQLDSERTAVDDDVNVEALRTIAWNDTLRSVGYERATEPETLWQRLVRSLA